MRNFLPLAGQDDCPEELISQTHSCSSLVGCLDKPVTNKEETIKTPRERALQQAESSREVHTHKCMLHVTHHNKGRSSLLTLKSFLLTACLCYFFLLAVVKR